MSCIIRYAALAGGLLLCGCDFTAGVYRFYPMEEAPLPACVEQALRQVPGVTKVSYNREERGFGRPTLERFSYEAEGVPVRLDLELKSKRPEYHHSYMVLNTVPPKELLDRLRPVMAGVDRTLETRCHIAGLSAGVQEGCPRGLFRESRCP
jgi:hypothetical protein